MDKEVKQNRMIQYFKDVRSEVAKVNWPTKVEVKGATVLVIIFSIIVSLYTFMGDQILSHVMRLFLGR
ncbi:MAG: preprotein translocase subunit SecE [Chitinispirillia bacterium]|nr:preprotein translocase subunit SecE [Chitinispirillia bacterium]